MQNWTHSLILCRWASKEGYYPDWGLLILFFLRQQRGASWKQFIIIDKGFMIVSESWKCRLGFFKSRRHHSSDWDKELCRHVAAVCGNVRHCCCCCSLLIIGSICRLSQLRLSRGLLQPIKCALSAPATPAARIIRPNYSSYSRPALFTGVGALINRSGSNTPPKQLSSDVDPFSTIR